MPENSPLTLTGRFPATTKTELFQSFSDTLAAEDSARLLDRVFGPAARSRIKWNNVGFGSPPEKRKINRKIGKCPPKPIFKDMSYFSANCSYFLGGPIFSCFSFSGRRPENHFLAGGQGRNPRSETEVQPKRKFSSL